MINDSRIKPNGDKTAPGLSLIGTKRHPERSVLGKTRCKQEQKILHTNPNLIIEIFKVSKNKIILRVKT